MTLKIRARQGENIFVSTDQEQLARIEIARVGHDVVDVYVDAPRNIKIRHEGDSPAESALKTLSFAVLDFIEKHGPVSTRQIADELALTKPSQGDSGFGGSERMLAHHLLSFLHGRELIDKEKAENENIWTAINDDVDENAKRLERVLDYSNTLLQRVSYAAVAGYIGVSQPKLWSLLAGNGGRCSRNSWIVALSGDTPGRPSRYEDAQLHSRLFENDHVVVDVEELRQLLEPQS